MRDVLRLEPGQRVMVFDGCGREAEAEIRQFEECETLLHVLSAREASPAALEVILLQAIPKGKRMDTILEKTTEIGVHDIVPVLSDRTIVRLDSGHQRERVARWQRVVDGAARQCGTAWVPRVHSVCTVPQLLPHVDVCDVLLVAAVTDGAEYIRDVASEIWEAGHRRIALMIGPEGDWTQAELEWAGERGGRIVSLGERVLRTETAALFGLSVLVSTCR